MVLPTVTQMKPIILEFLKDKKVHTINETKEYIVQKYKISDSDKNKFNEKRKKKYFDLQIVNALSMLRKEGSMENIERGVFKITSKGISYLQSSTNLKTSR